MAKIAHELELLVLKTLQPEGLFLIVQINQPGDFRVWIDWILAQTYRAIGNVLTHTRTVHIQEFCLIYTLELV